MAKAMGFENRGAFIQNFKDYKNSIEYLNTTYNYSGYDQETIKSLAAKTNVTVLDKDRFPEISDCTSNCKSIAKDKVLAATAVAVVAQIGCGAADAVFIGLICHAAVLAAQSAESHQAYTEMKQCINNCDEK